MIQNNQELEATLTPASGTFRNRLKNSEKLKPIHKIIDSPWVGFLLK